MHCRYRARAPLAASATTRRAGEAPRSHQRKIRSPAQAPDVVRGCSRRKHLILCCRANRPVEAGQHLYFDTYLFLDSTRCPSALQGRLATWPRHLTPGKPPLSCGRGRARCRAPCRVPCTHGRGRGRGRGRGDVDFGTVEAVFRIPATLFHPDWRKPFRTEDVGAYKKTSQKPGVDARLGCWHILIRVTIIRPTASHIYPTASHFCSVSSHFFPSFPISSRLVPSFESEH